MLVGIKCEACLLTLSLVQGTPLDFHETVSVGSFISSSPSPLIVHRHTDFAYYRVATTSKNSVIAELSFASPMWKKTGTT